MLSSSRALRHTNSSLRISNKLCQRTGHLHLSQWAHSANLRYASTQASNISGALVRHSPSLNPPRASFSNNGRRTLQTQSHSAPSVNQSEIDFFSRLSAHWWDEHGEFALLHRMNPARVHFVRDKILETARDDARDDTADAAVDARARSRQALRGMDVLDVGCGGGLLSESLARLGARTLGIDASEANVRIASLHAAADPALRTSLAYRHTPAETLAAEGRTFDAVCAMEVLEHVDDPAGFLATCASLVKPGGHLFLSTIARTPLAYLLTILAAEHVLRKVSVGTHTYSKFVNPSELVRFFQKPLPAPSSLPSSELNASTPWISQTHNSGSPTRTEAEVRGLVYVPWKGEWILAPRTWTDWGAAECNYIFWVRRPMDS
ncbi:ubiquinone biosynthesis O-methyltransferase [Coniophora puteana RWD-64-598 SS2]|uniref:Ubiquinone biosynthesis O-methyltransferase, mitochondrial n=1 Tax=Coniophora puteana (strain RWD-64-598) TaxID=741705 RepID=A0A5M3ML25_CONPW|nr:ubiquinone biosynthesis O-methyltransferase [Coniophora puteana RWD-64-598 SS2]EIW79365.1 ubiquinone biosynthesis O-methyltransferase [Coniophora puteana RWD-64-598 SS2]